MPLRWDVILLPSEGGILCVGAVGYQKYSLWTGKMRKFMHAVQLLLQISNRHQCTWALFNPVVRFRVVHMTGPRVIFDPPLHAKLRRTNVGNNEVL